MSIKPNALTQSTKVQKTCRLCKAACICKINSYFLSLNQTFALVTIPPEVFTVAPTQTGSLIPTLSPVPLNRCDVPPRSASSRCQLLAGEQ